LEIDSARHFEIPYCFRFRRTLDAGLLNAESRSSGHTLRGTACDLAGTKLLPIAALEIN
jgi:hypothetical protein